MLDDTVKQGILKFLKVEHADPEEQAALLSSIEEFSAEVSLDFIKDNLEDQDLKIFAGLSDEDPSGGKAIEFAKTKIPDFETRLTEVVKKEIERINI